MEHRAQFDLENNIKNWKAGLANNPSITKDNIDELESHLYDEISALALLGLDEEETFLIAQKRMGSTPELAEEFGKVNARISFGNLILPYLNGVLIFIALFGTVKLTVQILIILGSETGLTTTGLNWLSIVLLISISLIFLGFAYKKYSTPTFSLRIFRNIPFLVALIIITQSAELFTVSRLLNSIGSSDFGKIYVNLEVHKLFFMGIILVGACVFHFTLKKRKKPQIA